MRYQKKYNNHFRWRGFRLLGIDGMKMAMPASKQLRKHFPPNANKSDIGKSLQGLLVGLVGLFNGICYDFKITSSKKSEQSAARMLIKGNIGKTDLLMCDRAFPDYHTLALLDSQDAQYLFHLSKNRFHRLIRKTTPSGRKDE